jgi:hypothetical protein
MGAPRVRVACVRSGEERGERFSGDGSSRERDELSDRELEEE